MGGYILLFVFLVMMCTLRTHLVTLWSFFCDFKENFYRRKYHFVFKFAYIV